MDPFGYFSEFTYKKALLYLFATLYVLYCCIACFLLEPFLPLCKDNGDINTHIFTQTNATNSLSTSTTTSSYYYKKKDFENPAYDQNPCHHHRFPILLFMTIEECSFARRIVISALFGGLIGWERRQADRPAGIRTMSLVSLGSCLFSICSSFAFLSGPMNWDGSRVSAAIPSGVGFLGAGIIFKQAERDENGVMNHTVRGLTTATSLWLSAAVGIACGGELYFPAGFSVAVMLLLLRFGPRITEHDETDSSVEERDLDGLPELPDISSPMSPKTPSPYQRTVENVGDPEMQSLTGSGGGGPMNGTNGGTIPVPRPLSSRTPSTNSFLGSPRRSKKPNKKPNLME